ncbi:unnamed protein product, partial [Amoebophrya sp. A25]
TSPSNSKSRSRVFAGGANSIAANAGHLIEHAMELKSSRLLRGNSFGSFESASPVYRSLQTSPRESKGAKKKRLYTP